MGIKHKSSGRRRGGLSPEINVTPFVDILLVLLVVFMVASPALVSGLNINLPKASQDSELKSDNTNITLTLDKDQNLYLNDGKITRESLIAELEKQNTDKNKVVIFVRGDVGLSYGQIMDVINTLSKNGFSNVVLVTDNE